MPHEAPLCLPPSRPAPPSRPVPSRRGIVDTTRSTEVVRGSSPTKRLHHPSRWSEWPDAPAQSSARVSSRRTKEDSGVGRAQPKLLEALGFSPMTSPPDDLRGSQAESMPFLPDDAPENLEHCGDHCYWRWLVQTLAPEVAALRQSLKETEDEFQERTMQRREVENVIGYRDYILDDLTSRTEDLRKLREDVPQLRRDHEKLQDNSGHLKGRRQAAEAKQLELQAEIQRSSEWQKVTGRKLQHVEQECEEIVRHEQEVAAQIAQDTAEMQELSEELKGLTTLRDDLRNEVTMLEDAKKAKKRAGKAKT